MTIKRAPPHTVLSLDDHKKFTTFVSLFITVHQKTKTKKSKGKKNDLSIEISQNKKPRYS